MQIKLNVEKKYFFGILAAIMIVALGIGVYAFGTNVPVNFGHSAGEIMCGVALCDANGNGVFDNAENVVNAQTATTAGTATNANHATIADSADALSGITRLNVNGYTHLGTWTGGGTVNGNYLTAGSVAVNYAGYAEKAGSADSVTLHGCIWGTSRWVTITSVGENGHAECNAGEVVTAFGRNQDENGKSNNLWRIRCTQLNC